MCVIPTRTVEITVICKDRVARVLACVCVFECVSERENYTSVEHIYIYRYAYTIIMTFRYDRVPVGRNTNIIYILINIITIRVYVCV